MTARHLFVAGEVREALRAMPARSVDAVVTSPPYWGRRDYGYDGQLGTEPLHEYLERLANIVDLFPLKPGGIVWVNIGDTAVGSGGAGGDYNEGGTYEGRAKYRPPKGTVWVVDPGRLDGHRLHRLADGQWADVPGRLAHELQARGWLLRSFIVWAKPKPAREDIGHVRRPKEQHERVLMLTKVKAGASRFDSADQALGDVWPIGTAKGVEAVGKAPWPVELPTRMLEVSGPPGVVLDPFVGAGNTYLAAEALGWRCIGIDLDPDAAIIVDERGTELELDIARVVPRDLAALAS